MLNSDLPRSNHLYLDYDAKEKKENFYSNSMQY